MGLSTSRYTEHIVNVFHQFFATNWKELEVRNANQFAQFLQQNSSCKKWLIDLHDNMVPFLFLIFSSDGIVVTESDFINTCQLFVGQMEDFLKHCQQITAAISLSSQELAMLLTTCCRISKKLMKKCKQVTSERICSDYAREPCVVLQSIEYIQHITQYCFAHYSSCKTITLHQVVELIATSLIEFCSIFPLYRYQLLSNAVESSSTIKKPSSDTTLNSEATIINPVYHFPDQIDVNSTTQGLNSRYYVLLHQGRIFIKSRIDDRPHAEYFANWTVLGMDGLPCISELEKEFVKPESIVAISLDGWNLIAIGNNQMVYYLKLLEENTSTMQWQRNWGMPLGITLQLPSTVKQCCISHRGKDVLYQTDLNGNKIVPPFGVTSLYVLHRDGTQLSYLDPWIIPVFFFYQIDVPENQIVKQIAASASTLLILTENQQLFTRFADFDSLGINPLLCYTFDHETSKNVIQGQDNEEVISICVPPEKWKLQPPLPCHQILLSDTLTILQTGHGNESRELRIGCQLTNGKWGYFSKLLQSEKWQFVPSDYIEYYAQKFYYNTVYQYQIENSDITIQIFNFDSVKNECNGIVQSNLQTCFYVPFTMQWIGMQTIQFLDSSYNCIKATDARNETNTPVKKKSTKAVLQIPLSALENCETNTNWKKAMQSAFGNQFMEECQHFQSNNQKVSMPIKIVYTSWEQSVKISFANGTHGWTLKKC